jgi:hypothetical protein
LQWIREAKRFFDQARDQVSISQHQFHLIRMVTQQADHRADQVDGGFVACD